MAITHAQPTGGGGRSSLENVPARPKSGKNTARKSTGGKAPRKNRMLFLFTLSFVSSEDLLEPLSKDQDKGGQPHARERSSTAG